MSAPMNRPSAAAADPLTMTHQDRPVRWFLTWARRVRDLPVVEISLSNALGIRRRQSQGGGERIAHGVVRVVKTQCPGQVILDQDDRAALVGEHEHRPIHPELRPIVHVDRSDQKAPSSRPRRYSPTAIAA
jgi:hypothetical protein